MFYLIKKKGLYGCDSIDDLDVGRLHWIIWWALNPITDVPLREEQGEITYTEENAMHRGCGDRSDNLSQRCQQQLVARIGKDQILP